MSGLDTQLQRCLPWRPVLGWISKWKTFSLGLLLTVIFVLATIFAQWIAPYPPEATDYSNRFAPPSSTHLFGTDEHGRDIFSRVLYGGRVSLYVGIFSVLLASILAIPIGLIIGYRGGWADTVISRIVDALFAIPGILWALSIVAILGPSVRSAMIAIAVSRIPVTIRVARSSIITTKEADYVDASRTLGSSWWYIIFRTILPNCGGPLLVLISLGFAVAILDEAAFSYLGMSAQPPTPSWGNMLQESQRYLHESLWYTLFPGVTLFLVVMGLNLLGDGIRDIFDPRHNINR